MNNEVNTIQIYKLIWETEDSVRDLQWKNIAKYHTGSWIDFGLLKIDWLFRKPND